VTVEHIDGTTLTVDWVGYVEGQGVRLRVGEEEKSFPLNALQEIIFDSAQRQSPGEGCPSGGEVVFLLADGGTLCGEIGESGDDAVVSRTALGPTVALPFDRLAGIRLVSREAFPRADRLFAAALVSDSPGEDVLITRDGDNAKALRGRLVRVDAEGGLFEFAGRTRRFKVDNVFGVVFATVVADAPAYPSRVRLNDGSTVAGRLREADAERLRFETSLGVAVDLAVTSLASIRLLSDRVVYVSDLTPTREHVEGIMHRPWAIRRDRSCAEQRISIGGRVFEKGIGCHSRTRVGYGLGGAYELFAATIGIDDFVRPRGSVVFRVVGDGRVLLESGVLTGQDPPQDVAVDVTGVRQLDLVVDYGDGLDLADHADWGGARLIRPATRAVDGSP
jgi:hypothetical protein